MSEEEIELLNKINVLPKKLNIEIWEEEKIKKELEKNEE